MWVGNNEYGYFLISSTQNHHMPVITMTWQYSTTCFPQPCGHHECPV